MSLQRFVQNTGYGFQIVYHRQRLHEAIFSRLRVSIDEDDLETECRSSSRVPLIRRMKNDLLRHYVEMGRHQIIQRSAWLKPLDVVGREDRIDEILDSRRRKCRAQHVLCSVG